MRTELKRIAAASALLVVCLAGMAGCSPSEPPSTPIAQRKPGEDITPEARADKRGEPVQSASVNTPSASPTASQQGGVSPVTK